MAHRYTRKEDHLLSGSSELRPPEETQKFNSTHVQQPRQEYSQFTETNKAKFQIPFTYNDERNFVQHNSVDKFSPNLVYMTTPNTSSVSNSVFFRKKGRECRDSRNAEDTSAEGPAPAPVPAPAPAPTLETVQDRPHTPGTRKSTENFGSPASTYSDFYIWTLSQPGLADTQYNVGLYEHL